MGVFGYFLAKVSDLFDSLLTYTYLCPAILQLTKTNKQANYD
jgi:hypothetical protein